MAIIRRTPENILTSQDPGLESVRQAEDRKVIEELNYNPANPLSIPSNYVVNQVTQVISTVIQNYPPQGANGQIQINENGQLVGDTGLTYEPTTDTLTTGTINAGNIHVTGVANLGNVNTLVIEGGNIGDVLTTNGSGLVHWANVYPNVANKSGSFLVTDGINVNWSNVSLNGFATQNDISNAIGNLVNSAPSALNTLGELANALGNSGDFTISVVNQLANKVNTSALACVATSGSYTDLVNKPTNSLLPTQTGQSGKYLTTNGTTPSWSTVTQGGGVTSYNDLTDKPILFSGSYADLTNKPALFSGSYNDLTSKPSLFSGSYVDLTNKPSLFSGSYVDLTNKPTLGNISSIDKDGNSSNILYGNGVFAAAPTGGAGGGGISLTDLSIGTDGTPTGSGNISYANSTGVFTYTPPVIPTDIANLADATNLLFDGDYTNLTNKPTLGNISSINTDGNASNVLYGNGIFAAASVTPSTTLDNSSAGDMDVMTYDGNLKYTSNVTIDVSTGTLKAKLFSGNGSSLTSLAGANVTGTVANATIASSANAVAWANVSGKPTIATFDQDLNTTDNVTFNTVNTQVIYAPVGTPLELYSGDGTPIPSGIVFNGAVNGGGYMVVPSSSDWALGTVWTIEFRIKITGDSTGKIYRVIDQDPTGAGGTSIVVSISNGQLTIAGTDQNPSYYPQPTINVWTHIAIVNNNATTFVDVYYDGVLQTNHTGYGGPSNYQNTNALYIGKIGGSGDFQYLAGVLSGIRISKVARYTQNFTLPTEVLASDSDTLLLMNVLSGAEYDDSSSYARPISHTNTTLGSIPGIGLDPANVVVSANAHSWTFGTDGGLTFPDNTVQTTAWTGILPNPTYSGSDEIGVATPAPLNLNNSAAGTLLTQLNLINTGGQAGAGSAIDFWTYTSINDVPEVRLQAVDDGDYSADFAIKIKANGNIGEGNLTTSWTFGADGDLTLPIGGVITETSIPGGGLDGNAIALKPNGGTNSNQQLLVYPTGNADYNHLHLTSGNLYSSELFLGNDNFYVKLANTGNIVINSNDNNGNVSQWRFNTDGSIYTIDELTLNVSDGIPTSLTKITNNQGWGAGSVGSNLPTTGGSGTGLTVDVADGGSAYAAISIHTAGTGYTDGDIITVSNGGMTDTFTISVPGTKPWVFDMTGNLTLPAGGDILDSTGTSVLGGSGSTSVNTGYNAGPNTVVLAGAIKVRYNGMGDIELQSLSGTIAVTWSGQYITGGTITMLAGSYNLNTSAWTGVNGNMGSEGDTIIITLMDKTNSKIYRVTTIVTPTGNHGSVIIETLI